MPVDHFSEGHPPSSSQYIPSSKQKHHSKNSAVSDQLSKSIRRRALVPFMFFSDFRRGLPQLDSFSFGLEASIE